MSVSPSFRAFVLEQLEPLGGVTARAMFGGAGLYRDGCFFALLDDDVLYLKVDDTNRPDFDAVGTGPFRPFGEGGEVMSYYEVPADVLEDRAALAMWAGKAVEVARRAAAGRKKRRK